MSTESLRDTVVDTLAGAAKTGPIVALPTVRCGVCQLDMKARWLPNAAGTLEAVCTHNNCTQFAVKITITMTYTKC